MTSYHLNHYNISSVDSIVSFLTADEIIKSSKGELTEDDVLNIVNRILEKEDTKESSNVKTK